MSEKYRVAEDVRVLPGGTFPFSKLPILEKNSKVMLLEGDLNNIRRRGT